MVMSEPKFFSTKGCGLSSGPHPFILSSRGSLFPDKTDLWNSPPASSSPVNHTPTIASGSPSSFRVWVLLGLSFPVKSGFMQWRVCTLNFPSSPFFTLWHPTNHLLSRPLHKLLLLRSSNQPTSTLSSEQVEIISSESPLAFDSAMTPSFFKIYPVLRGTHHMILSPYNYSFLMSFITHT